MHDDILLMPLVHVSPTEGVLFRPEGDGALDGRPEASGPLVPGGTQIREFRDLGGVFVSSYQRETSEFVIVRSPEFCSVREQKPDRVTGSS